MTVDLKKVLILNLPYLLFVYLFDKLCQAVRLAPGLDASEKFLHLSHGFTEAFSSGCPACIRWTCCAVRNRAVLLHDRIRATYAYSVQFSACQ